MRVELAESVRALAVSQGEVSALKQEVWRAYFDGSEDAVKHHFANGGCKHAIAAATEKARGDLERARGLLAEALPMLSVGREEKRVLAAKLIAFLYPSPTASPEPDRASPEVTVKENDHVD